MQNPLTVVMAQLNFMLGDVQYNTQKIIQSAHQAKKEFNADIIVYPELAMTGYPPEDLLFRPELHQRVETGLEEILNQVQGIYLIVGHPQVHNNRLFNAASVLYNGEILLTYHKQHLPNYSVFDEKRYFENGDKPGLITIKNNRIALTICEDLWLPGPMEQARANNADLILSLNASPFHTKKPAERIKILQAHQATANIPILYVNCVGGQDELVFDGGSMYLNANGNIEAGPYVFDERLIPLQLNDKPQHASQHVPPPESLQMIYDALVLGTRDYIRKNNFKSAILGLSGGIDSALTLAIAADAIGPENVRAYLLPSRFTSTTSIEDAELEAQALGVKYSNISIEKSFQAFLDTLADEFNDLPKDTTEENIQARCRGIILMAISNKTGAIVLTTGNKSETAVGYSTLYGDLAGGFAVLKDVPKTLVYELASYRNSLSPAIPERVITKPPSAELREDQLDSDSLPPYSVLDKIIELYVEHNQGIAEIANTGIDITIVKQVVRLIDSNEYKRRQSPPGVRISPRAFGRDWRYPITSAFGRQG